ncbi:MAG: hypothetical protein A3A24_03720 [Candidatus Buchananbacteria bacterium RIFCSPLOWO2_01_FULL_46_12]|uniref:Type II secretion system protein GspF domain-containing protein n=2 Tax=Candidatus Buchananiibacteriota TaxID=1817903 RepID=A0A1G1YVW1_9BACT|nr:MAG: hypothetical protein A2744_01925 [Candidatus Buchananbacteria bacterium RIFCSPHIGHO2_01_FULL_44_11]OGY55537.1 MAG: hypothetical protein A3A24_03720 [Candidatus Buchananbacteria bacterium RIFCSPLOWO2_01_FULL_46_12]
MKFDYVVFDRSNQIKKGSTQAADLKEATQLLISQGWFIKKIKPRGRAKGGFGELSLGRVSLIDKVLFTKHLSTMLKSGITLNEALAVIADQTTSQKFKKIILNVLESVKTGQNLSRSLEKFPKVFDSLFINIIKVGEESGTLEGNLEYLSHEVSDQLELRRKVKAAAFYPAIVLFATGGLIVVLAYFVLPKITQLFRTLKFDLPLSTKVLLWVSDLMEKHGGVIILSLIIGLVLLRAVLTSKFAQPFWHRLILKLPVVGTIVINYNLTLMNRTLGILLKSGLTIDRALAVTTQTLSNLIYQRRLTRVLTQIQKGQRFSDTLAGFRQSRRHPLFPLLVVKMIDVGERSGRLDESFSYLAEFFEKEVDNTTKNLTTILEPLLLVFIGLIVGFVAISVIAPIYQVTGQLGGGL